MLCTPCWGTLCESAIPTVAGPPNKELLGNRPGGHRQLPYNTKLLGNGLTQTKKPTMLLHRLTSSLSCELWAVAAAAAAVTDHTHE